MNESAKKQTPAFWPAIAAAFSLCFIVFVYAPYELYLTNQVEFWFSVGQMLKPVLLLFAGGLALLLPVFFVARRLGEKGYTLALALGLLAVICTWIQGSYLVFHLPPMDGSPVDWGAYPLDRALSIGVWVVFALLILLARKLLGQKRFRTAAGLLSLAVCLLLAVTLGTLFLTTDLSEKNRPLVSTDEGEFVYSEDENFLILVLDALDGTAFEQVLERDPAYPGVFDDFTYYQNTTGGYPYTQCSVPLLLTGAWYEADRSFLDYERQALLDSPLLNAVQKEGFRAWIFSDDSRLLAGLEAEPYENLSTDQPAFGSLAHSCKLMIKMALIKHAPWDLKFLGYDLPGRLQSHIVYQGGEGAAYFNCDNLIFYDQIRDANPVTTVGEKCFKYLHLAGAHEPHVIDKDLNELPSSPYRDVIEGNITMVRVFLQRLREAGVYDNTAIVICSDHGSSNGQDLNTLHQHPILLIKGRGEHHPFRTDDAPISFDDLQPAFLKLLDGAGSEGLFPWKTGDARERRFFWHETVNPGILTEYMQTGHAEDMETLLPTGRVLEYKK